MIIGGGDIASALIDSENKIYFASGVSNSACADNDKFKREIDLLLIQNKNSHLVYFSSLSIFYTDTPYTRHKKLMELLVKDNFSLYTIVRMGNITWGKNPNTIINFLSNKIKNKELYEILDEYRYIVHKDEFQHWMKMIPNFSAEMNITGEMMKVSEIVTRIKKQCMFRSTPILIKYATRGRPHKFKLAIENIQSTIKTNDYLILVSADEDDTKMNNQEITKFVSRLSNTKIIYGKSKTKVEAINADMDKVDFKYDILINTSDDMEFIVDGWDSIMINKIKDIWKDSLDFFAHFNDGYIGDKLPTMSIMGRTYYERFNYIYHHSYASFSCDAEAMYVAMMLGKYNYFNDILFKHQHPSNNGAAYLNDETYIRNGAFFHNDTENYFNRLKNIFYVANPTHIPFDPNLREQKRMF